MIVKDRRRRRGEEEGEEKEEEEEEEEEEEDREKRKERWGVYRDTKREMERGGERKEEGNRAI